MALHRRLQRLDRDASKDAAHNAACWLRSYLSERRWLGSSGNWVLRMRTLGQWRDVAEGFWRRDLSWGRRRFTGIGYLSWYGCLANGPFAVANDEDHQDERGERRNPYPCGMPPGEPAMANSFGAPGWRLVGGRKRKRNDLPAVRANGEMRECLLLLMRGQGVFDEGAELVRVWMLPGLKNFAHGCPDAAAAFVAVCSENEVVCELCSKARRLISRSRGSLPSASSAARLLSPPA